MARWERVSSGVSIRRDSPRSLLRVDTRKVSSGEFERGLKRAGVPIQKQWSEGETTRVYRVSSVHLKYPQIRKPAPERVPEGTIDTRQSTRFAPGTPPTPARLPEGVIDTRQSTRFQQPPPSRAQADLLVLGREPVVTPRQQPGPRYVSPERIRTFGQETVTTQPREVTPVMIGLSKDVTQEQDAFVSGAYIERAKARRKEPPQFFETEGGGLPRLRVSETLEFYTEAGLRKVPDYFPAVKEYPFSKESWPQATTAASAFVGGTFFAVPLVGQAAAAYRFGEFGGTAVAETVTKGAPTDTAKGLAEAFATPKGQTKFFFGLVGAVSPGLFARSLKPKVKTKYVVGKTEGEIQSFELRAAKKAGQKYDEYSFLYEKPSPTSGLQAYTPKELLKQQKAQDKGKPKLVLQDFRGIFSREGELKGVSLKKRLETERIKGYETLTSGRPEKIPEYVYFQDMGRVSKQFTKVDIKSGLEVGARIKREATVLRAVEEPKIPDFLKGFKGKPSGKDIPYGQPTYDTVSAGARARANLFGTPTKKGTDLITKPPKVITAKRPETRIPISSEVYLPMTDFAPLTGAAVTGRKGVKRPATDIDFKPARAETMLPKQQPRITRISFEGLLGQTQIPASQQITKTVQKTKQPQYFLGQMAKPEVKIGQRQKVKQPAAFKEMQKQITKQKQRQDMGQAQKIAQRQRKASQSFYRLTPSRASPRAFFPEIPIRPEPARKKKKPKRFELWGYRALKHPVATPREMLKRFFGGKI